MSEKERTHVTAPYYQGLPGLYRGTEGSGEGLALLVKEVKDLIRDKRVRRRHRRYGLRPSEMIALPRDVAVMVSSGMPFEAGMALLGQANAEAKGKILRDDLPPKKTIFRRASHKR